MFENVHFIKPDAPFIREHDPDTSPCFIFRRRFEVRAFETARVSVCGLGYGYYYINGRRITPDMFTAPVSNYNKTLWFNTYDVTDFLQAGGNVFTVLCGNGFFNEAFKTSWNFQEAAWRDNPKFILSLEIDGVPFLTSDEEWKCAPYAPVIYNHLRSGEHFDSRLYDPDFCAYPFDDSRWSFAVVDATPPQGVFRECVCQPIRECAEYPTVAIIRTGTNRYVFDIGQNISGYIRLKIRQKSGDLLTIRYAEQLEEDHSLNRNKGDVHYPESEYETDKFITNGKDVVWSPLFAYHGFRYVEIEGLEEPHSDTVTGIFVHQAVPAISGFTCSDKTLNALYKAGQMSTWSNLFYMPTDCPTREKMGWMNDAQASAEQMLIHFDIAPLFRKWNIDITDAMAESGCMPGIVPTAGWGYEWGNGPVSDGSLFEIAYMVYLYTGDRSLLLHNLPYFERYLAYLKTRREPDGMVHFGLDDWTAPGEKKVPTSLINTALLIKFLRIAGLAASFAGNSALRCKYAAEEEENKRLFKEHFLNPDGTCAVNEQTAVSMVIFHRLYDELEPLKRQLKKLLEERDFHHNCGMVGLRHLFIALNRCGLEEYAYKAIVAKGYPSFTQWLDNGATTLWETWEMEFSKNHHMYSDFMAWLMKTLVGIQVCPEAPAYEKVEIHPRFIPGIDFCRGYTETPRGKIAVSWKREGEAVQLEIALPADVDAVSPYGALKKGTNIITVPAGTTT